VFHKLSTLIAQGSNYLRLALQAATQHDLDRDTLKERVLGERSHLEETESELRLIARQCAAETRPHIMTRMRELQGPLEQALLGARQEQLAQWKLNLRRLSRAYENWLWQAL